MNGIAAKRSAPLTAAQVLARLNANATIALTPPVTIANTLATTGAVSVDIGSGALPGSEPASIAARLFATDANSPRVFGEAFGASGLTISGRAVGGTRASSTATPANTNLLSFTGLGYDGTSYTTSGAALYNQIATTLWTASNHETHHQWRTTPNGSTTAATTLELHHGRLLLGVTLPTDDGSTALQINGGIGLFAAETVTLATTATAFNEVGLTLTTSAAATSNVAGKQSPFVSLRASVWNGAAAVSKGISVQTQFVSGVNSAYQLSLSSSDLSDIVKVRGDTGAIAIVNSLKSTSPTAGIGYDTGAGGTVTQASNKSTGVTLNTVCGTVTLNNAALASATSVSFTLTDSAIAATDLVVIHHDSVGALGGYGITATPASGSATITVRNNTAGSLSEAIVLRFVVIKAVTS